jgi:hypothetical protein
MQRRSARRRTPDLDRRDQAMSSRPQLIAPASAMTQLADDLPGRPEKRSQVVTVKSANFTVASCDRDRFFFSARPW